MAKPELGTKRVCVECSTKYFDLNRQPIACPKCGAIFEIATRDKMQPADEKSENTAAKDVSPEAGDVVEKTADNDAEVVGDGDGNADIISLEEAEADDAGGDEDGDDIIAALPDDDLVIDDDDDDEVFVKDDDDDDDVSDIVATTDDDEDT